MTYTKITLSLILAAVLVVGFTAQDAFAASLFIDDSVENEITISTDPFFEYGTIGTGTFPGETASFTGSWLANSGSPSPGIGIIYFTDSNGQVSDTITANWDTDSISGLGTSIFDVTVQSSPNCEDLGPVPAGFTGTLEPTTQIAINGLFVDPLTGSSVTIPSHLVVYFTASEDVDCIVPPTPIDPLTQIFEKLTDLLNAITGVQDTVDRIETTVNNVGPNTERVSVTVNLDEIYLESGEVIVLLDTTGSGTLSTVHVAANLPCDDEGVPLFNVVAGVAGGDLSGVITEAADNTGFNGPYETCVYHNTVSADTLGHDITDVIMINPGIVTSDDDDDYGDDRHDNKAKGHDSHDDKEKGYGHEKYDDYDDYDSYESEYLEGVTVTITGIYN